MDKVRFVGLDVHEESISLAVADSDGSSPSVLRRIPHDLATLVKALKDLSARAKLKVAYEAGSAGFGLQRKLERAGFECVVVAPLEFRRRAGPRQTPRTLSAWRGFSAAGTSRAFTVSSEDVEGLRALTRAREDALQVATDEREGSFGNSSSARDSSTRARRPGPRRTWPGSGGASLTTPPKQSLGTTTCEKWSSSPHASRGSLSPCTAPPRFRLCCR